MGIFTHCRICRIILTLVSVMVLWSAEVKGQVTTNSGSGLAATYPSLADAITDLNAATISSPVEITLSGSETAPTGGYIITAQGTAVNTIIIQGNISTITAATQTPGNQIDAIVKIVGGDFITIQNFTFLENASNTIIAPATNTMTEWGIALLYATPTNGSQNNIISNNIFQLNRTYINSVAIYSNVLHQPASPPSVYADITNISGSNSNNVFYSNDISDVASPFIIVGSRNPLFMDTDNEIGGSNATLGNTVSNWGNNTPNTISADISSSVSGIYVKNQSGIGISNNIFTSFNLNTASATRGIFMQYTVNPTGTFTNTITGNTITLINSVVSPFEVIRTEGISGLATATQNITQNTLLNCTARGEFNGIVNASSPGILTINSNTIRGTICNGTTQNVYGIRNIGTAISNVISMDNNSLGNTSGNFINFSAAYSGILTAISNEGGTNTCDLSISGNNFTRIVHNVAGTGNHFYINNLAVSATLNQTISNNTFTNLSINSSGSITFIRSDAALVAAGNQTINNNSIVTSFTKSVAGGTVIFVNTTGTAAPTSVIVQNLNNFSIVTIPGATSLTGFLSANAGSSNKTYSNNTFSNWVVGSGSVTAMSISAGANAISNNTINGITGSGSITGIFADNTAGSNPDINHNTINGLTGTGILPVNGISSSAPTATIAANKIYTLTNTNIGGSVNGVSIIDGTTVAIYNNIIGDLRTPAANADNTIVGLNISGTAGTTINAHFNSIWLNGTSTGTNFGSSAVFANTIPTVNLRNNIFVNTSVSKGTGRTVVYRRSSTNLTTYAIASNNNLYFVGVTGASQLIYFDGTNSDATFALFQTRVGPTKDAFSINENPPFVSLVGSSSYFLHISNACLSIPTGTESGGVSIVPPIDDFDGEPRFGQAGYVGNGSAPDIGADEFNPLSVVVTATAGTPGPTNYTTLRNAFASINNGIHQGNITIELHCNTIETNTATLNASLSGLANYTKVTIYPVVSGLSISTGIGNELIDLNGADNVLFDGRVNLIGQADLSIIHTNTSNNSARNIRLLNSAQNDTIRYCKIKGACPSSGAGVIFFSNSNTGTGNSNNVIENCELTNSGTRPRNMICSSASLPTTGNNNNNKILNNKIYNFLNLGNISNGIYLGINSSAWEIAGNSFYETAPFIPTANVQYDIINISNSIGDSFVIEGNYIGGSEEGCAGTAWNKTTRNNNFYGIFFDVSSSTNSSIQGNVIRNFAWTNSSAADWTGISIAGGEVNTGTVIGNTIGSSVGTNSIVVSNSGGTSSDVIGIRHNSAGNGIIQNNTIGSITTASTTAFPSNFYGIYKSGGTGSVTISNNRIGSTVTPNSIYASSATTGLAQQVYGIANATGADITISENTIGNMSNAYSFTGVGLTAGIGFSGGAGTNTISRNFIHSLSSPSIFPSLFGIRITSGGGTFTNNIISLGNTVTPGCNIYGIFDDGTGTRNIYFNTVYIGGTVTAGNNNTYALYNNGNTATRNYRNNILYNVRSGGLGTHYTISLAGNTGLTIDYNEYFTTGGILGRHTLLDQANLVAWRAATTQDVNSVDVDPVFPAGGGTAANGYKPGAPQTGTTIAGITTDYNGSLRAVPVIGALEGTTIYTTSLTPSTVCAGGPLDVCFTSDGTFGLGNVYTAQLSDSTGSFSSPVNLTPVLTSNASGSDCILNVIIPAATPTPPGAAYKIRVISSIPAVTNDAGMHVTINTTPVIPAQTDTICSGGTVNFTPTNNPPTTIAPTTTTYTWTAPIMNGGITGGAAEPIPQLSIIQTLSNPSSSVETAIYTVTPTTAGCTGTPFQLTVHVNPTPQLSSLLALPGVCSNTTFTYIPSSVTGSVNFEWEFIPIAGLSASPPNGTGNISTILTNTTSAPIVATFQFTLTTNGCSNIQYVTVPVTQIPMLTNPSPVPGTVCSGQPFIFTATSDIVGTTYNWTRAVVAGISNPASSGNTATINETLVNTTSNYIAANYIFTLSSNGCTNPVSEIVTVVVVPIPVVIASATPNAVCPGMPFDLYSSSNLGVTQPAILLSEDFETGSDGDKTGPNGWTTSISSPGNATQWTIRSSPYTTPVPPLPFVEVTINSNTNDKFYLADNTPSLGNRVTSLISPPGMNTAGYTSLTLDFWNYYRDKDVMANDYGYIDVSTDDFSTFTTIEVFNETHGEPYSFSHEAVDLTAFINFPNVRFRFRFEPTGDYYWAIDNVTVTGTSPIQGFSWTSIPAGYTNTLNPSPVGLTQSSTTTYIATYTDINAACPGSASVIVTNHPLPVPPVIAPAPPTTICAGGTATFTTASPAVSYQWNLNGSPVPGATLNTYTTVPLFANTNVSVSTTNANGCYATSVARVVTVTPVIVDNTVASAQTICSGATPAALTGTLPTGGNGTYTYLWESSTTSAIAGFAAATGTNNSQNYTPGSLALTTWFRRRVTSGGCTDYSTAIEITVNPVPTTSLIYHQ